MNILRAKNAPLSLFLDHTLLDSGESCILVTGDAMVVSPFNRQLSRQRGV